MPLRLKDLERASLADLHVECKRLGLATVGARFELAVRLANHLLAPTEAQEPNNSSTSKHSDKAAAPDEQCLEVFAEMEKISQEEVDMRLLKLADAEKDRLVGQWTRFFR